MRLVIYGVVLLTLLYAAVVNRTLPRIGLSL